MRKKFLAMLLAVVMALGLLPVAAFAADSDFVIEEIEDDEYEGGTIVMLVEYTGPGGDVVIPDGVTSIGLAAFLDCTSLTSVTIPDSVTTIGMGAFDGCTSLTSVTIPDSVTFIGPRAFAGTPWQQSLGEFAVVNGILFQYQGPGGDVVIPNGVATIGFESFFGCGSLVSVTIPDSVTSIDAEAFLNCGSLTSVTIPASVTTIGTRAFMACSSLTDVYYGGSESQWDQISADERDLPHYYNEELFNAHIYFNSTGPDTTEPAEPTEPTEPTEPETPALPTKFADIPAGEYYTEAVAWAVDNKITNGTGGKQFSPKETCSEVEILTMLYRASKETATTTAPIPVASWYQDAVNWAYEKGMIGDDFKPDAPCTRANAVYYIWLALGEEDAPAKSFTDVDAEAHYAGAVSWAVNKGVTNGTGNKQFSPDRPCMREEIVTFLYRAYK